LRNNFSYKQKNIDLFAATNSMLSTFRLQVRLCRILKLLG